ncbi:MAG: SMP-30/gluconolactonase/LRE family protein [Planctomycetota bacterium]
MFHSLPARSAFTFLFAIVSQLTITQLTITQLPAQSPVNLNQPLKTVRTDFDLCDGAAASGNSLFVPDVKRKQLFVYNPANREKPWRRIAAANGQFSGTFYQLGTLYIADSGEGRLLTFTGKGKPQEWITFSDDARPNDLVVDIAGNAYVTITRRGEIRKVTPDGAESVVAEGLTTPNGITLSPDGTRLYVSETKTGQIIQFAVDEDSLTQRRPLARVESEDGAPKADGMTCDRAGNVYCAGANAVWIWTPSGKLLDKISTEQRPINCVFGGPHGLDLFISTFGGLVKQPMKAYGIQPNRASSGELAALPGKPSTRVPDTVMAKLNTVFYRDGTRNLLCDLFLPQSNQPTPGIILVHGGGWLHGDKTKFRSLAIELAKLGYGVMAIEYRLGFERRFPVAIQDCNAALAFLAQNADALNVNRNQIAAVGGSAGGHLVGLMATGHDQPQLQPNGQVITLSKDSRSYDINARLAAAVVMAGPMEIASGSVAKRSVSGSKSNAINWLGKTIDASPDLYRLADAFLKISADDPPLLFIRGSLDNPSVDEPSLQKLRKLGVNTKQIIHEGAKHGHWNRPDWMPRVVDDIHAFLQEQL